MNEVVEHLAGNLLDAIQNAVDCVRPGGYLMVTTPNLRSIWGLYALIRKHSGLASKPGESVRAQYDRASAQFGYYGHVREYTKREVVALFRSFGLTLHAYEFQGRYQPLGKISGLLGLLEKIFPEWRLFGKYIFKKTD
jgi:predicted SAM-dependent methyltransferase